MFLRGTITSFLFERYVNYVWFKVAPACSLALYNCELLNSTFIILLQVFLLVRP